MEREEVILHKEEIQAKVQIKPKVDETEIQKQI